MAQRLDFAADAQFLLGPAASSVERALAKLQSARAVERLWDRDGSLWSSQTATIADVQSRLGWLDLPGRIACERPRVERLADEVRGAGYTHAVLMGMGGSSLAPEVLREILGVRRGYLDLHVLDTTDPAEIRHNAAALDLQRTLLIVSSKSGTTAETRAQYLFLRAELLGTVGESWPQHLIAITDPGTALAQLANEQGFRALFHGVPEVGGRFSALSLFGLVPAALLGIDLERLAAGARAMAHSSQPGQPPTVNSALRFGATLGELARQHEQRRDKLTLLTSPRLSAFGAWAEQLIAESTGKGGLGIVPIDGEAPLPAQSYGADRLFVYLRLDGDDNAANDALAAALVAIGQPLVYLRMPDLYALGGEFFRWEYATAIAGQVLGVNPFDQPNVEAAKQQARQALAQFEQTQHLQETPPVLEDADMALDGPPPLPGESVDAYVRRVVDQGVQPGGYVAVMAYVERSAAQAAPLGLIRSAVWQRTRLATTLGYGPRFLHSTGQLHKGGPDNGFFLQIAIRFTV